MPPRPSPADRPTDPHAAFWSPMENPALGIELEALNTALLERGDEPWAPHAHRAWEQRVTALGRTIEGRYRAWPEVPWAPGTPVDTWTFLAQPMASMMLDKGTALTRYAQSDWAHPAIAVARRGSLAALEFLLQRGSPTELRFNRGPTLQLAQVAARSNLAGALARIQARRPADGVHGSRLDAFLGWLDGAVEGLHPERLREAWAWCDSSGLVVQPEGHPTLVGGLLGTCQRTYVSADDRTTPLCPPARDEVPPAALAARAQATLAVLLERAPLERWTYTDGHQRCRTRTLNQWLYHAVRAGNAWAIEPLRALGAVPPSPRAVHAWAEEARGQDGPREQGCRAALAMIERFALNQALGATDGPLEQGLDAGRRRL